MAEDKDIHKGHRERMMKRFRKGGIDVFHDHEKLEVLLYQIIPRINTNNIAHNLINSFGSLKNVFLATVDELVKVKGIGEKSALQIKFIGDLAIYLNEAKIVPKLELSNIRETISYCKNHFKNKTSEVLTLLMLDDKCALLDVKDFSSGQPNHIQVNYREIVGLIIKNKAYKLIIAHNHIMGTAEPSDDDKMFTRSFCEYLNKINVGLIDHIIVSNNDALSMRNNGYLNSIWDI